MADIKHRIIQALLAAIEAVFVIMGVPTLLLRPSAVTMDKWLKLKVRVIQMLLGLSWNKHDLTTGITSDFGTEVAHLLKPTWHDGRQSLNSKELEVLVEKTWTVRTGIFSNLSQDAICVCFRRSLCFWGKYWFPLFNTQRVQEVYKESKVEANTGWEYKRGMFYDWTSSKEGPYIQDNILHRSFDEERHLFFRELLHNNSVSLVT